MAATPAPPAPAPAPYKLTWTGVDGALDLTLTNPKGEVVATGSAATEDEAKAWGQEAATNDAKPEPTPITGELDITP